jgi:putative transposase
MVVMSKLRLSQDQIKAALSELAAGRTVREISREYGISPNTLYRWRAKRTNGQQPDAKDRLRSLEDENRRLKKEFAELTLDYTSLRAALVKDVMGDC